MKKFVFRKLVKEGVVSLANQLTRQESTIMVAKRIRRKNRYTINKNIDNLEKKILNQHRKIDKNRKNEEGRQAKELHVKEDVFSGTKVT